MKNSGQESGPSEFSKYATEYLFEHEKATKRDAVISDAVRQFLGSQEDYCAYIRRELAWHEAVRSEQLEVWHAFALNTAIYYGFIDCLKFLVEDRKISVSSYVVDQGWYSMQR